MPSALLRALASVTRSLDELDIPYCVVGSLASSSWGVERTTLDADLTAELTLADVPRLSEAFGEEFYADQEMIRGAIESRASFNLIHLGTMDKVDVFITPESPWEGERMRRRVRAPIHPADLETQVWMATAEDVVLHKLLWYQMSGGVSERQWGDIQGVLRVQASALDLAYMRRWAPDLGVTDLLERALSDAGFEGVGDE